MNKIYNGVATEFEGYFDKLIDSEKKQVEFYYSAKKEEIYEQKIKEKDKEIDIINNLKTIVKSMEENEERKNIIYAYYLETKKKPIECDCERGMPRVECPKCKGAGYYLIEDNKGSKTN